MKTIKTTTLENKFNKLHNATALAEDCINASVSFLENAMAQETDADKSIKLGNAYTAAGAVSDQFVQLGSTFQSVESRYWDTLDSTKGTCSLIDEVPVPYAEDENDDIAIENRLYDAGFYVATEGEEERLDSLTIEAMTEHLAAIRDFLCVRIKHIVDIEFPETWTPVRDTIYHLHDLYCEFQSNLSAVLSAYGITSSDSEEEDL